MLTPKEIKKLFDESSYSNLMTMFIYLANTGGEARFESWYNLNPQIHEKVKNMIHHYSRMKHGTIGIKWDEDSKQFISREEYNKRNTESETQGSNTPNV